MHNTISSNPAQTIKDNVKIFLRDTSPYYYCQIKKPDTGKWVQRSTKTIDADDAMIFAQDWYSEMRILHKRGYSSTPTLFSRVCDLYLAELDKELTTSQQTNGKQGRSIKDIKNYRNIAKLYIEPYFANKSIDSTSNAQVQSFFDWRRIYWTEGPGKEIKHIEYERAGTLIKKPAIHEEASNGTINRTGMVLADIFKTAVRHQLIEQSNIPITKLPKENARKAAIGKRERKPAFTTQQYKALLAFLPKWCLETSRDKHLRQYTDRRLLLWDMFELLANTGMRPGTESDGIKWKHIEFYKDKRGLPIEQKTNPIALGEPRVSINIPTGKNGARLTTGNVDAANAILRIKRRRSDFLNGLTESKHYYERLITGKSEEHPTGWITPAPIDPELHLCALPNGEPVSEDSWRTAFNHLLRDFGLTHDDLGRKFSPYAMRHSYITWQLEAGSMTLYDISEQCGHSVDVLVKHYAKNVNIKNNAHRQKRIGDIE